MVCVVYVCVCVHACVCMCVCVREIVVCVYVVYVVCVCGVCGVYVVCVMWCMWCVCMWCMWGVCVCACVIQVMCHGAGSLLPPLHGYHGWNSGHQAYMTRAFTRWASSLVAFSEFV